MRTRASSGQRDYAAGASTLPRIERCWQTISRALAWICNSQRDWGGWVHTVWYKKEEDQPFPAALDLAQELCAEMSDTIFDLG